MGDVPVYAMHAPPLPIMGSAFSLPPPPPDSSSLPFDSTASTSTSSAHADTAKMKSCAVCRLRRVKCEREAGERQCIKCKERGLDCKEAPVKEKGRFRDGKRVKIAKEMYGSKEERPYVPAASTPASFTATPAASQSVRSPSFSAYSAASSPTWHDSSLSYSSANTRLGTIELKSGVMGSFLDAFLRFRSVTTFDGDINFQLTFDQAGRRVDQLSEPNQVLCGALLALGARCSDHPALVGSCAPRISDLTNATQQDLDLRPYGKMRAQAVSELSKQALRMADEKGALRMSSPESVAALMLLEGLLAFDETGNKDSVGYANAYKGQIRHLISQSAGDQSKRTLEGTVMSWTAYVRDAMTSAFTGISPTFSEEDAWLLRRQSDPPPPLADQLLHPLTGNAEADFWTILNSYVHHITELARETPSKLTGPRASKAAKVDEKFVKDYIARLDVALDAVQEMLKRAANVSCSSKMVSDAEALVRTLRLSACHLAFLLHLCLEDRLSRRPAGGVLAPLEPHPRFSSQVEDEYWERLEVLNRKVSGVFYKAAKEIVAVLAGALSAGIALGTHAWVDSRSSEFLFSSMPSWVGVLLRGPPGVSVDLQQFQLESKISDLSWILRAMRSAGWATERPLESYDWIARELAKLETLRSQQQYFLPEPLSHPPPAVVSSALPTDTVNSDFGLNVLLGLSATPLPADLSTTSTLPAQTEVGFLPPSLPPISPAELDSFLLSLNDTGHSHPLSDIIAQAASTTNEAVPATSMSPPPASTPTSASSMDGSGTASSQPVVIGLQHDFPDLVVQFPDLF
ncbi:hypothetical protein JCM11251_001668 [Rhodosporidiobolus azoricus]